MPLWIFRRENNDAARRERLDKAERRLAESFRALSSVLSKAAELLDARRLERGGYERPQSFLQRTDLDRAESGPDDGKPRS